MEKKFFSSESVTEGHPDKLCDRISDSILDKIIESDPTARVACETCATTGLVMVMGEITTSAYVDIAETVRAAIADIGYNKPEYGFDAASCAVLNSIHEQSPDIAMGVDHCLEAKTGEQNDQYNTGAGDQGMVFGYACDGNAHAARVCSGHGNGEKTDESSQGRRAFLSSPRRQNAGDGRI